MNRRFMVLFAAGIAACGAEDDGSATADQPTPSAVVAESADAAPVAVDTLLPPGLAPVAIDNDRPTSPAAERPRPVQEQRPLGETPELPAASEPQQEDAAAILRRAAAAYEEVRSMRADFVMVFNNPLLRQQTTSRGTLYQQSPDRIALRFSDPAGDVILSDGEFFFVYQPSVDPQQATRTPATPGGGGGVDLKAQFVGNPIERFTFTLHGREAVDGREAHAMTLVPRARADYRSLKVWFDTRDSLARRFEITEHNGSVRRFDLTGLRVNPEIPADVFRFTPPAGVRIVNVG